MQTVSFAGSSYNIPNTRGDRPWSGLSDFVIAAASKAINTAGGNFTLLADINFGATFGLVSTYYKSRTANVASAGQIRLANTDTIKFRNTLNNGDLSLSVSSNNLTYEATKVLLSGAVVNADIQAAAAIAVNKLAALTASRALVSDGSGFLAAATTTATEIGYVNGVTSAIQTQLTAKKTIATGNNYKFETTDSSGNLQETTVTASRAVATDANGLPVASATTATELGYVNGVTSAIQTQLDGKAGTGSTLLTSTDQTASGVKTFSGQLIGKGTATNDSAAAGYIGEYVESVIGSTSVTNGTYVDGTSISLTAGDWDVSSLVEFSRNAATFTSTDFEVGISVVSGNNITGLVLGSNYFVNNAVVPVSFASFNVVVPGYRLSLSATTTVYMKVYADTISAGTAKFQGRLSARRVR